MGAGLARDSVETPSAQKSEMWLQFPSATSDLLQGVWPLKVVVSQIRPVASSEAHEWPRLFLAFLSTQRPSREREATPEFIGGENPS